MEVFDKDIEFLKDIWANDDQRELVKRVVSIGLGRLNKDIPIDIALALGDELDEMLLEKEKQANLKEKNMTV